MTGSDRRTFIKASGTAGVAGLTSVAGCLGDLGSSGGDSNKFTIATTLPKTGAFSAIWKDLHRGYELGIERINDNGGLHGKNVEMIVKDDESDPQMVREKLKQIISNNDVDMIWGSFAGVLVTATAAVAEQEEIPMLAVAFSDDKLHEEQNYQWTNVPFPKSSDHVKGTKSVLELVPEKKRPTKVGLWVPNTDWSIEMADMWDETLTKAGFKTVLRKKHQLHASDFSTLISQSKQAGVEILLGTPAPDGGITAMKQINQSSFSPKFVQLTRAADTAGWWNALGEAGRNVVMAPGWVPGLTGNGNEKMENDYYDKYDAKKSNLPPVMTGACYNLTQVAEQALGAANSTKKSAVRDALRNTSYKTVCGEFSFDDVGRPKGWTSAMGQWIDGDQHLVSPKTDGKAFRKLNYPLGH
ncbi:MULTISPECIES: amino acid ABC transporter substrate-binding protein [unclassified Haladaptatus]|uniref:amino acid ABC transporter substrate-binding protein n=1 Tax=unclassified Haladaptatus TaxID=2622732 RepID=UPI00209BDF24|nr:MULTISPECIES: amino acid ABC transporter substrate-binding protein [unclassified Haladaptatus]MCO8243659.1 amino acid ABC transporter substrate-binding protein [Haladaptatus sp. AB643]MCO8255068.1 amino acid ABC transporter substrate-binding protein [Haladaptatus sp. AB618]